MDDDDDEWKKRWQSKEKAGTLRENAKSGKMETEYKYWYLWWNETN